jgi:hypothetical protein
LATEEYVTSQGYITSYTETDPIYTSERDALLLNKTVHPTLLFSTLADYNKPSGYSTMIQPSSYQNPLPSHGYYHIIARRDTGGGYGALLQSYNSHELYHGNTTESTTNISWYKIWNSGDFTSTNVSNWDTAYNDKINSASFNTTNGVLTLTQQDGGTVTVDLDGRYLTSETDSQTLSWEAGSKNLSISNGNTVTLDGLATEEFVTSQGYITSYTETDTLASVVTRNSLTYDTISVAETTGGGYQYRTSSAWGGWARNGFSFANGSGTVMKALGAYGGAGTQVDYMYLGNDYLNNNFRIYTGHVYVPSLDLAISNANSDHGASTYFRGDTSHFVFGLKNGNTLYFNYGNGGGSIQSYGTLDHSGNLNVVGGGNLRIGQSGSFNNLNFVRNDGSGVGAIGWKNDGFFYIGGHPDYGPGAGNDVRVYGFGSNLYFGNNSAGDVARISSAGVFSYGGSEVATRSWVQSQGYLTSETDSQTLSWEAGGKNLTISNGNTVTLDGLATEEYVTSQGYITGYTETDTLASVTGRGASTATTVNFTAAGAAVNLTGLGSHITFKDQDNVWVGYVGFDGNTGRLEFPGRNAKIVAGYNGTIELNTGASGYNSGRIHIPYGYLSVDNNYVSATAFHGQSIKVGTAGSTPTTDYGIFHQNGVGLGIVSGAGGTTQGISFWSHNGSSYFESVRIAGGNGNVSIGATSSYHSAKLSVAGKQHFQTSSNSDIGGAIYSTWTQTANGTDFYAGDLRFQIFNASTGTYGLRDAMMIDGKGYVGINTLTPSTQLQVVGVITATGGNSTNWNTAYGWGNHADYGYWNINDADTKSVQSSSVRFVGDVEVQGTFTESSSIRFKENIKPLELALSKVEQLNPVTYNKIGVEEEEIGLIAEEVAELFPEVVTYNEEGLVSGVQYQRLSVILLKAMQEQNAVIAALTERVNKLENK